MAKYFAFSFLSLGAILILSSGDVTGQDVHPLMLFQIGNTLQRPYDLEVKQGDWSSKIYRFTADADPDKRQIPLLFCGATTENQHLIKEAQRNARERRIETDIVSKYCLFEWKDSWGNTLIDLLINRDFPKCKVEPEPLISRILSDENTEDGHRTIHFHCGPEDKGVLYRYGYQIWLREELFDQVKDNLDSGLTKSKGYPHNIVDYEIFRICYDSEAKQVLYTQHTLISPKLLRQRYLTQEIQKQYPISENNFDLKELNFRGRAMKYNNYSTGVGSSGTPQNPYLLNQLVPETDFSFSLWQKPMFHIVNYDLLHEDLYYLWNAITITCKNYAERTGWELDVYTKTFNMHEKLTHKPQLWIKVIHQYKRAVAIIANNEMDKDLNAVISQTYCNNTDYCETFSFGTVTFNADVQQYIKCCVINEEIENLFNFNPSLDIEGPGVEGLIWIPGLTV